MFQGLTPTGGCSEQSTKLLIKGGGSLQLSMIRLMYNDYEQTVINALRSSK